jgi:plastocyanin
MLKKAPLLYVFLLVFWALSSASFARGEAEPIVISMYDDYFSPRTLVIKTGQKVSWINKGHKVHAVSSSRANFNSGRLPQGARFSYVFTKPGVYSYSCSLHSFLIFGMRGEVIVR